MIFIDANVPMYLMGAAHPHKTEAQIILERLSAGGARLVTDAEILQEILHRYAAIDRRDAIRPTLAILLEITDEVFAVTRTDVLRASEIVAIPPRLSARDALHLALMERHGIVEIFSFDADFDRWPGIRRIAD